MKRLVVIDADLIFKASLKELVDYSWTKMLEEKQKALFGINGHCVDAETSQDEQMYVSNLVIVNL